MRLRCTVGNASQSLALFSPHILHEEAIDEDRQHLERIIQVSNMNSGLWLPMTTFGKTGGIDWRQTSRVLPSVRHRVSNGAYLFMRSGGKCGGETAMKQIPNLISRDSPSGLGPRGKGVGHPEGLDTGHSG